MSDKPRRRRTSPRPPNARQRRFIDEYLRTNDAPASAIAAGYSESQAKKNAGHLLRSPTVAHVLRAELDARAERTRIAADRIVLELARVAFSDIARIADWREDTGWRLRPPDELGDADRAAIARVRLRERDVQIVLHDKIRALDTLGKYFKLCALATQARAILDAKDAERARKLAEEEEWAAAWRAAFG